MAHLVSNEHHWYLGSPFQIVLTIENVSADELSNLFWRIDGFTQVTDIITQGEDTEDALVVITVNPDDTLHFPHKEWVYDWQLMGTIRGTGPEVLAIGKLRLVPLAIPPAPYSFMVKTELDDTAALVGTVS